MKNGVFSGSTGRLFAGTAFLFLFLPGFCWSEDSTVSIGVLAKRGTEQTVNRWQATAEYLTERIPSYTFEIVPLSFHELTEAVQSESIDFVLANPAYYVSFEARFGAARIATMKNLQGERGVVEFGSVVFARSDRPDIPDAESARGQRVAAVDEESFGGWLIALREFRLAGIHPERHFQSLTFTGTHDAVVMAVLDGSADVGIVRTDTLERMEMERLISLKDFTVLSFSENGYDTFPFLRSTRLYPEWPFATLPHTDRRLAELVAAELILMPPDEPAARTALIAGWTVPGNYQSVHESLKETRSGPYAEYGIIRPAEIFEQYRIWIILLAASAVGLIVLAGFLYHSNRELNRLQHILSTIVQKRTAELIRTNKNLTEKTLLLEMSLADKMALLREVHHRVKNNLQVITSLLHLQSDSIHDPKDQEVFRKLEMRIASMSLVHESIEDSENAAAIPVRSYTEALIDQVMALEQVTSREIAVTKNIAGIEMEIGQAIPFGLILCELLSNAIQFGVPVSGTQSVSISLAKKGPLFHLAITDNGPGLPDLVKTGIADEPNARCRLGLQLVQLLVTQTNGTTAYSFADPETESGTLVTVMMPAR